LRILLINHRYFVASGAERYLFNVERALNNEGNETAVFSIKYRQNKPSPWEGYFTASIGDPHEVFFDQHRNHPATYPRTIARLFYSAEVERDISRLIEDFKPDVAYLMLFLRKLSPSVIVALHKAGIPIVVRVSDYGFLCAEHHFLRDGRTCTKCLDGRLLPGVVHGCVHGSRFLSGMNAAATWMHRTRGYFDMIDTFVTTNPFLTEMMIKGGYAPEKLVCIPTFADEAIFRDGMDSGRQHLLYAGRLDPSKGLETLIDAMAILKARIGERLPPLRIVGGPQYEDYGNSLVRRAAQKGVGDLVHFDGALPDDRIPNLLGDAVASIIPSLWFENLPNSYLESLSAGVPVIASGLGSLASAITHDEDGLLFQAGDPSSLADQIQRLLNDPGLEQRLRCAGPALARREYSARRHLELLTDCFESLVAAKAKSEPPQFGLRSAKPVVAGP
jgi:glycosyltransferase involved in cell wall biosynthesis